MGILIGFVIFVLSIFAILDCVKSNLATEKKFLWVLLIICLPILGLILYYLVGKTGN